MLNSASPDVLARASIPVAPNMAHLGVAHVDVYLRATKDGRFRWFHANDKPTVVEGASVDQAIHTAQIVWSDVQPLRQPTGSEPDLGVPRR